MIWSFPIGRLLGSEVRVHVTFVLLLAWIGGTALAMGGTALALANLGFVLALFGCVLAHEFGHALMARRFGIATPDITLLPIGGLARLDHMPEDPRQEILVALAGPLVNVAIWAVLVLGLGARSDLAALVTLDDPAAGFLARLAMVNLALVLFNLIPAFPMDGGRVLRAVLALWLGRVRATQAAARTGQAIALVFGFLGVSQGNALLVLIAVFVFLAAQAESADVSMRALARPLPARAAMITEFLALAPDDRIETAATSLLRSTQHEFPVLGPDRRLVGFLTRQAIFAAMAAHQRARPVAEVMDPPIPQLSVGAPLQEVLDRLATGVPAVGLTDRSGALLGYVTPENVGELVILRQGRRG